MPGSRDVCAKEGLRLVDLWNTTGPANLVNGTAYEEDLFTGAHGHRRRHVPLRGYRHAGPQHDHPSEKVRTFCGDILVMTY